MNFKKILHLILLILLIVFIGTFIYFYSLNRSIDQPLPAEEIQEEAETDPALGLMILIEYRDTVGLVNFVNEMDQRGITGLLHVDPTFVTENCQTIRALLNHNIEMMASIPGEPLWGVPYEEQKAAIADAVETIESCTGQTVRIISSRYMASDLNTIKAAQDLGIPYITARGTTDTKATVYQVEDYQTRILSVSNIPEVTFKYGSLCDYSYFERGGTPDNMMAELNRALEPLTDKEQARYGSQHRVTPVTHTNIGGYLKPWMEMWTNFWETTTDQINWVDLDEFMAQADWTLPSWKIPINRNAPYTPESMRQLVPYEDVEKVDNPCRVEDLTGEIAPSTDAPTASSDQLVVFHNGSGPMCLEMLEFLPTIDYPIAEFLEGEEGFLNELNQRIAQFESSQGVSSSFGYYPIIFVGNQAFSGFNEEIKNEILEIID